jgi:hypothetical protein
MVNELYGIIVHSRNHTGKLRFILGWDALGPSP